MAQKINPIKPMVSRILGYLIGLLGLCGMFACYFISTWHLQHAPLVPNVRTHEIYPLMLRGEVIYLTRSDLMFHNYSFPAMFVLVAIGGALIAKAQRSAERVVWDV